ncbi:hypothetical protein HPB47_014832 [Ixodes persulcatus]|uniref:Uncharacterized protein n=1 Tax=Ixodes persulcatus TaxID=34615 RepID=A0AC60QV15_IXOPE|nr:hypothetical protein HPB47_014832 [Ixodes persulcatus]
MTIPGWFRSETRALIARDSQPTQRWRGKGDPQAWTRTPTERCGTSRKMKTLFLITLLFLTCTLVIIASSLAIRDILVEVRGNAFYARETYTYKDIPAKGSAQPRKAGLKKRTSATTTSSSLDVCQLCRGSRDEIDVGNNDEVTGATAELTDVEVVRERPAAGDTVEEAVNSTAGTLHSTAQIDAGTITVWTDGLLVLKIKKKEVDKRREEREPSEAAEPRFQRRPEKRRSFGVVPRGR